VIIGRDTKMESSPFHSFMQQLFQRYQQAEIPHFFTIDIVVNILKENYFAVELNKKYFEDLKSDSFVNFENIIGAYTITDIKTLENLYSAEEKIGIFEFVEYKKMLVAYSDDSDNELAQMWSEIQEGRRINIILESNNGINISGFTVQGGSEKICDELIVMQGLEAEDCKLGNEKFHNYLKSLIRAGYL
jgi:hypothetical protein